MTFAVWKLDAKKIFCGRNIDFFTQIWEKILLTFVSYVKYNIPFFKNTLWKRHDFQSQN